jgi:sn-glycerol 3-phosphate transport system permease protein
MVERKPLLTALSHFVLLLGVLIVAFPVYITFVASTHSTDRIVQTPMPILPGAHLVENYHKALSGERSGPGTKVPVSRMMTVSLISALVIAIGKIAISLLSAFAIVYFRFPFRQLFFWMIFITLMLPVEVRIGPTYKVVSDFGMLNSYASSS